MEHKCPKCGRDFSYDKFWTTDLRRHLARKNPCDRAPGTKYIKDVTVTKLQRIVNPLDSCEMKDIIVPDISMKKIGPWFFNQFVNHEPNVCFVKPNVSKNEIWVRVSRDELRIVTIEEFVQLFVNLVMIKWFPEHADFESWLFDDLQYELSTREPWDGEYKNLYTQIKTYKYKNPLRIEYTEVSTFYKEMKNEILSFMHTYKDRTTLKNLLSLNINGNFA
jgi:hypothetical protein